jgi:hypothetical protein
VLRFLLLLLLLEVGVTDTFERLNIFVYITLNQLSAHRPPAIEESSEPIECTDTQYIHILVKESYISSTYIHIIHCT